MLALHEKYIIDEAGKKTAVVIPFKEWKKVREVLEEYDDIRAYDVAKKKPSEPISLQQCRT